MVLEQDQDCQEWLVSLLGSEAPVEDFVGVKQNLAVHFSSRSEFLPFKAINNQPLKWSQDPFSKSLFPDCTIVIPCWPLRW